MLEESAASNERYQRFLTTIQSTQLVWSLQNAHGFVNRPSNEHENRPVLLFWSAKACAKRCAVDEWSDYQPASIPLPEFLDRWLPGMHNDSTLVGPEWNGQLLGLELEPMTVLEAIRQTKQ